MILQLLRQRLGPSSSSRVWRTAAAAKVANRATMATMPPRSKSRTGEPNNRTDGVRSSCRVPAASRIRQLGRSHLPVGDPERADGVRGERDLDRQQVIGQEQSGADAQAHEPAENQTADEEQNPQRVEDVIDVIPVTRPLVVPHAGQVPSRLSPNQFTARKNTTPTSAIGQRGAIQ